MTTCKGCGIAIPPARRGPERLWCSQYCRKQTLYSGTCIVCGGRTSGVMGGIDKEPDCCSECSADYYKRWPEERIIRAIKEWARLYGEPPTASEWRSGKGGAPSDRLRWPNHDWDEIERRMASGYWPRASTIQNAFGSWAAGLRAAGFNSEPGRYREEMAA